MLKCFPHHFPWITAEKDAVHGGDDAQSQVSTGTRDKNRGEHKQVCSFDANHLFVFSPPRLLLSLPESRTALPMQAV